MLFYGNLLGYAKLLQRSADVLLVAYVAGDRETGLYKLARQIVDGGIAVVQDALYQVYFPDFLDLLTRRAATAYRALARRLGEDEPDDPYTYAEAVLQRSDPAASAAISLSATALGSGIAGLVNAHDPDVITLGGLAVPIRQGAPDAFDTAYPPTTSTFRPEASSTSDFPGTTA